MLICRIYINGSIGSSMTYVNGTDDYDAMNVSMLESESFGPDLLMLETTKPIKKDEELFMYYGSEFILPVNDPIDVFSAGYGVKVGIGKSRTKIAARLRAPPMSPAAPPKRLNSKKKPGKAPSPTLGKRNASEAGGGSNKKTKRNRNGE